MVVIIPRLAFLVGRCFPWAVLQAIGFSSRFFATVQYQVTRLLLVLFLNLC